MGEGKGGRKAAGEGAGEGIKTAGGENQPIKQKKYTINSS